MAPEMPSQQQSGDAPASAPSRVGIHALSLYFPKNVVLQTELEKFDGASSGKYTVGLGQQQMAFCADDEDIVSIALTATADLLEQNNIDPASIGFLAVGTETLIDKSKSVKTELMRLFAPNCDIEGVDVKNACFGGTQAMLHAVDWVHANWETDGRLAIAVLADIAVYEAGPARCTGGCGAMAVLIGPDAPLSFERGLRACHMTGGWDFYKPIGGKVSEFPEVDGANSVQSYMQALDGCYSAYKSKAKRLGGEDVSMASFDAVMFHSPFTKLVQKAVGRLALRDFESGHSDHLTDSQQLAAFAGRDDVSPDERSFVAAQVAASASCWETLTSSNLEVNRRLGNCYTPSVLLQLVGWLARQNRAEGEARLLMFAYGSGCASAMMSLRVDMDRIDPLSRTAAKAIARLDERTVCTPEEYTGMLALREKLLIAQVPVSPAASSDLFPGTFRLQSIDEKYRRTYSRTPLLHTNGNGHAH